MQHDNIVCRWGGSDIGSDWMFDGVGPSNNAFCDDVPVFDPKQALYFGDCQWVVKIAGKGAQ
jgi:hypothetical protein